MAISDPLARGLASFIGAGGQAFANRRALEDQRNFQMEMMDKRAALAQKMAALKPNAAADRQLTAQEKMILSQEHELEGDFDNYVKLRTDGLGISNPEEMKTYAQEYAKNNPDKIKQLKIIKPKADKIRNTLMSGPAPTMPKNPMAVPQQPIPGGALPTIKPGTIKLPGAR